MTLYWCDFCGSKFATFVRFPSDIMPYCPNCANDEDIIEIEYMFVYNDGKTPRG